MAKKGHSEEQILQAFRQAVGRTRVADLCCDYGVSEATFYVWKKKYSGLALNELRELRQLRDENAKLKRLGNLTGFVFLVIILAGYRRFTDLNKVVLRPR